MARFPEIPTGADLDHVIQWANLLTRALNQERREITVGTLTLVPDDVLTLVSDPAVTLFSEVFLMPLTASAAADVDTTFLSNISQGSFSISHTSDPATDRNFAYATIEREQFA